MVGDRLIRVLRRQKACSVVVEAFCPLDSIAPLETQALSSSPYHCWRFVHGCYQWNTRGRNGQRDFLWRRGYWVWFGGDWGCSHAGGVFEGILITRKANSSHGENAWCRPTANSRVTKQAFGNESQLYGHSGPDDRESIYKSIRTYQSF